MLFLKHPAWLWLKKHDKSKLPDVDASTQALFDAGFLFETYAEKLFPTATRIGFSDYRSYLSLPQRTNTAIREGHKVLLQARFEHEAITCITDVVVIESDKSIELYEIKSSTGVRAEHLADLAFQKAVLEGCGYRVSKCAVIFVNSEYVRHGEIDITGLCHTEIVTAEVQELQTETEGHIQSALAVANASSCPNLSPTFASPGGLRDWLPIYSSLVPQPPASIYELVSLSPVLVRQLQEAHITQLKDIPQTLSLNDRQKRQLEAARATGPVVDVPRLRSFLEAFKYPLYFLDYETMSSVIPPFDETRPYQQIPFQFSLHIKESPTSPLRHATYLHRNSSNPARDLSEALKTHIGHSGTILAWYASFEKSCNDTLASIEPSFRNFFKMVNDRIEDLIIPFQAGWYLDSRFKGSASIKLVLPALAPDLSYKELSIGDGGTAQRLWMQAVLSSTRQNQKERILRDLDTYCALDTMAMVRILEVLQRSIQKQPNEKG
jgi:hypothetical protein